MTDALHFDDSLQVFVQALFTQFKQDIVQQGWVVRDPSGHLAFIAHSQLPDLESANVALRQRMGAYCRSTCIFNQDEPGVSSLLDTLPKDVHVAVGDHIVPIRLLDRRIVGQDWLTPPVPGWESPEPARFVFASLKGGVGRSTAMAVLATDLARKGRNVLAIDLDLEAPGIGSMLLPVGTLPKYGVLDWLMERSVYGADFDDNQFLLDMREASPFALNQGLLHVVPALGAIADRYPENVLAKLARAYLEVPQTDGKLVGLLGQVQVLVKRLANLGSYDVILIDARAGLNESTAAALLGLGGDILLFGVDTPQTFASYRYLLAHLAGFPRLQEHDWLYRLRMVHAKAAREVEAQVAFRDRAFELFNEFLYRPASAQGETVIEDVIEFSLDSEDLPHFALPILFDGNYAQFDPLSNANQLNANLYQTTYASLIAKVEILLDQNEKA